MIPELDEHDMGECEGLFGYLCETCRVYYQERADELEHDDNLDEQQDWK